MRPFFLKILADRYVIAIGLPIVLLLIGVVSKRLARGGRSWERQDFFLGIEIVLATISVQFVYISEFAKLTPGSSIGASSLAAEKLTASAMYIAITLLIFVIVLVTHLSYHNKNERPIQQICLLAIGANLIGILLLTGFIILIKGA